MGTVRRGYTPRARRRRPAYGARNVAYVRAPDYPEWRFPLPVWGEDVWLNPGRHAVMPVKEFLAIHKDELPTTVAPAAILLWESFFELYGFTIAPQA